MSKGGGEYVWFVDADDEVDEYSLLYIHESLRQNPADCVFLGYEYVWGEKRAQVAKKELSPSELFYVLSGSEIIEKVMIPLF
ncbi:glycosyltransferase [Prevotella sp. PINT]|nr:glycosyltransferase [Palleniella intestinalis]